jgi:kinesin family protein 2/24
MISQGMSSCEHSLNTLRYADRVKELAANDPMEMKTSPCSEGETMKMEDNGVLDDNDLAQLQSLNVILTLNVVYFLHHCQQSVFFSTIFCGKRFVGS